MEEMCVMLDGNVRGNVNKQQTGDISKTHVYGTMCFWLATARGRDVFTVGH